MENNDILISGASIAGPALAYWLRKRGFNPTVVERAPAPRPGGQTVDLRGAGRTVVQRMGLMDRVRELCLELGNRSSSLTWSTDFLQLFFSRRWSTQIFNDIFIRSNLRLADERGAFLDHQARCF